MLQLDTHGADSKLFICSDHDQINSSAVVSII